MLPKNADPSVVKERSLSTLRGLIIPVAGRGGGGGAASLRRSAPWKPPWSWSSLLGEKGKLQFPNRDCPQAIVSEESPVLHH